MKRKNSKPKLQITHPEIAKQWHPQKNQNLTPSDVVSGSNKKVWWKCPKDDDHEWQSTVYDRCAGKHNCPYCSGKRASSKHNLQIFYPEIAQEWLFEKNKDLTPFNVTPHSGKKVWWKCKKGHTWRARIADRAYKKSQCPYCSGRKLNHENSLANKFPLITSEWHPTKNKNKSPNLMFPSYKGLIWWICSKGHTWESSPSARINGKKCPKCLSKTRAEKRIKRALLESGSIIEKLPQLMSEWHPSKNTNLDPNNLSIGSNKKPWWRCNKGHEWQAMINSRANGRGCPYCAGKKTTKKQSLLNTRPELIKEWNYNKNTNINPSTLRSGSNKKVWWKCKFAHEWQATIYERACRSTKCPYCQGKKASRDNEPIQVNI